MSSAVETTWLNCNLSFMVQSRKDGDARGGWQTVTTGRSTEEDHGPNDVRSWSDGCNELIRSTCTTADTRISHHVTTILRILEIHAQLEQRGR